MKYILIFLISLSSTVSAQNRGSRWGGFGGGGSRGGSGEGMSPVQKQEAKEKSRWTMADWLDTKKVIANQNMWLAGNRSKPVAHEFYASYEQAGFEKTSSDGTNPSTLTKPEIKRTSFGAFTSFVGLSGDYLDFSDKVYGWNLNFNLRIFGNSVQNTNFTLIYGGRTRVDNSSATSETFRNPYFGASFALYLSKQFGIEGLYQNYEKSGSDLATTLTGNNIEGTLFIDYGIIRVQGTWFKESIEKTPYNSSTSTAVNSTGILAGGKFYF